MACTSRATIRQRFRRRKARFSEGAGNVADDSTPAQPYPQASKLLRGDRIWGNDQEPRIILNGKAKYGQPRMHRRTGQKVRRDKTRLSDCLASEVPVAVDAQGFDPRRQGSDNLDRHQCRNGPQHDPNLQWPGHG